MAAERERTKSSDDEVTRVLRDRELRDTARAIEDVIYGSVRAQANPPSDRDVAAALEREETQKRSRERAMSLSPDPASSPAELERRILALEEGRKKLEDKFDRLETKFDKLTEVVRDFASKLSERLNGIDNRLTAIEGQLATKAAKTDLTPIETKLGTLDGRVAGLPTTPAMIGLVMTAVGLSLGGAAGLAFTLFKIFKP